MRRLAALGLVALLGAACARGGSKAPVSLRAAACRLAFISERDGAPAVYLLDPAQPAPVRVSRGPGAHYNGPAAPDGSTLLITTVRDGPGGDRTQQLFAVPLAGGEPWAVAPAARRLRHPAWSRDGASLFFESDAAGLGDLFRARRDGQELLRLTRDPEGSFEPALSPRGDAIAYVSSRDRVAELYLLPLGGGPLRRLTHTPRDEWAPSWSADGARLAFASDQDGADRVYLMDLAGGAPRRLTQEPLDPRVVESSPAWSPQGSRLAYVRRRAGEPSRLFVVDVASGARAELRAPGGLAEPAWSPDGRYLAFSAAQGSDSQIYLAPAEGGAATALTHGPGPNWHPGFVPNR